VPDLLTQPATAGNLLGAASVRLRHGSLFTGVGGIDLGLEWAGFETAWQVENNLFARKVLEKHWEDVPRLTDVRECGKHNLEGVDIISGGFPCQQVSCAGKREGIGTAECPTERSGLWFEFLGIIRELRPPGVLIENVSRLLRTRDGDSVLSDMEQAGYSCTPLVLGAEILGAPHERKRAWILCHDRAADRPGIEGVMTEHWALPPECQRRMEKARGRWDYWKNELRGGSLGTYLPKTITPTATAILVKDWSGDSFLRLPNGRWRKRTRKGNVNGSMSWAQEMAVRAAAQGSHNLEPTPECCEEFMGFPAGWTDLGAEGPEAARYARTLQGVRGMPDWVDRLRALGNAVVPQIPMLIGCFIQQSEASPALPGTRRGPIDEG
jgi:site-specific DNA-cytosine methylase